MKHLNNLYKFKIFYKINFMKFIGERMNHPRKILKKIFLGGWNNTRGE